MNMITAAQETKHREEYEFLSFAQFKQLRAENESLRQQLAAANTEIKQLDTLRELQHDNFSKQLASNLALAVEVLEKTGSAIRELAVECDGDYELADEITVAIAKLKEGK